MRYKILAFLLMMQVVLSGQSVEELIIQAHEYNPGLKALRLDYEAALQKADQEMIPWKGSLDAKSDAAKAMAEVKSYSDEVKEIDIEYAIRNSYATLQFLEGKKGIIQEKLEVLDALEELAKSAVRSGKGKLSNVLFIERKRETLEANLALLDKKIEQPTVMINRWTGKALDTKIVVEQETDVLWSKEEVIQFAENGHPQFRILENQKSASNAKLALINYDSKPKIGVGLDYAYIDGRNDVVIPRNGRDVLRIWG